MRATAKPALTRMAQAPTKKNRHVPTRTCVGCRQRRPDSELVRIQLDGTKPVIGGRGAGRGAWICADAACIETAGGSKAFFESFPFKTRRCRYRWYAARLAR